MPKEEGGVLEQRRPIYETGPFVFPSSRPLDEPTTDDPRHGDSRDQEEETSSGEKAVREKNRRTRRLKTEAAAREESAAAEVNSHHSTPKTLTASRR